MALLETVERNVRPWLDAIDTLRQQGLEQDIALPTIVVIGDQSSGKTSLLESLSGITLPKGTEICTWVPLVLRMASTAFKEEDSVVIEYLQARKDIRCDQVEKEVFRATEEIAGKGKDVVDEPISLTVKRRGLVDLTLVDLPGITRVSVGNQDKDIARIICDMVRKYIGKKEAVILNVLTAETDFTLAESINLSRDADPEGTRTLAAVTKVDRAPEGLKERVERNSINLKLGYALVRNKTKEKTVEQAREAAEELFRTHPELSTMDRDMLGIDNLAKRLLGIQTRMVAEFFPEIERKVSRLLEERERELAAMPEAVNSPEAAAALVAGALQLQREMLAAILRGDYTHFVTDTSMHFAACLQEVFECFKGSLLSVSKGMLSTAYFQRCKGVLQQSASGVSLPNLLGHSSAAQLVQLFVEDIREPCEEVVADIFALTLKTAKEVARAACAGYPNLEECFRHAGRHVIENAKASAASFMDRCLEKERSIVFTSSPVYTLAVSEIRKKASEQPQKVTAVRQDWGEGYAAPPMPYRTLAGLVLAAGTAEYAGAPVQIGGLGPVDVTALTHSEDPAEELQISMFAYSQVVVARLVDTAAMEVRHLLRGALLEGIRAAAEQEVEGRDRLHLVGLDPNERRRQQALQASVARLRQAQEVVQNTTFRMA